MKISNVNVGKLHQEFKNNGIYTFSVLNYGDYGEFTFKNNPDIAMIQQIIDSHDPTPEVRKPTPFERIEQLELEKEEIAHTLDTILTEVIPNLGGN